MNTVVALGRALQPRWTASGLSVDDRWPSEKKKKKKRCLYAPVEALWAPDIAQVGFLRRTNSAARGGPRGDAAGRVGAGSDRSSTCGPGWRLSTSRTVWVWRFFQHHSGALVPTDTEKRADTGAQTQPSPFPRAVLAANLEKGPRSRLAKLRGFRRAWGFFVFSARPPPGIPRCRSGQNRFDQVRDSGGRLSRVPLYLELDPLRTVSTGAGAGAF